MSGARMRRKAKKVTANSSGWPLLDPSSTEIPPFLANALDCIEKKCLDVEGLFRISALQADIEKTVKQWKRGKVVLLGDEHTVAGSVKLFFREFDDPLLTYELYDAFIEAASQRSDDKKLQCVSQAIALLPPINRALLKALLEMLHKMAARSSVNKMTAANLAIVFAPSIIRAENETQMSAMMSMRTTTDLVEFLIVETGKRLFVAASATAPPPLEAAPDADDRFVRELRRGTIRLGTRLMMKTLETIEMEEEMPPEIPDLPDELVADVLQEQLQQQHDHSPIVEAAAAIPSAAAAAIVPTKVPVGAVKMVGRAPPPQALLPETPPQEVVQPPADKLIRTSLTKTVQVKSAAAVAAAKGASPANAAPTVAAAPPAMPDLPPELPSLPHSDQVAAAVEPKKMPVGAVKMLLPAPGANKTVLRKGAPPKAPSGPEDADAKHLGGAAAAATGPKTLQATQSKGSAPALLVSRPVSSESKPVATESEGNQPALIVAPVAQPAKALAVPVPKNGGTLSVSPRPVSMEVPSHTLGGMKMASQSVGGNLSLATSPRPNELAKSPRPGQQARPMPGGAAAAKSPAKSVAAEAAGTIRHSTTSVAARKAVAEKMAEVLAASKNKKTAQELLAMMAAGDLVGVNLYLNSLSKVERDETRLQLKQLSDPK